MGQVTISKGLLAGLAAVAVASLLGVAYLLGRASGGRGAAPAAGSFLPPGGGVAAASSAPSAPAPAPAAEAAASLVQAPPSVPSPAAPAAPASRPTGQVLPPPPAAPDDPDRTAVAAYLAATDRIQEGKMRGDAEGMATELASALAHGDTSGLDRLIRETEDAKGQLALLSPPAPCALHHRESLASLDDALDLLRSLKAAVGTSDPAGPMAAISARGAALRSRAETLEREERALRLRYGLVR